MKVRPKRFLLWMESCPVYILRWGCDSVFALVHPAAEFFPSLTPVYVACLHPFSNSKMALWNLSS